MLDATFDEVGLTEIIGPAHFSSTLSAAVAACSSSPE
jgi:hypothetical protein